MFRRIYWISLGVFIIMTSLVSFPLWLHEHNNPVSSGGVPGLSFAVHNDSVVSGKILSIRNVSGIFPFEIDIQVERSLDVASLTNYTRDKIGQVLTTRTNQDVKLLKPGDYLEAHCQMATDVTANKTFYYIHQGQ